jgi:hypothetical protein
MSADIEENSIVSCAFCGSNDNASLLPGPFGMSCSDCRGTVNEEERSSPKRPRDEENEKLCSFCSCCDQCCDFVICHKCGGHCEGVEVDVEGKTYCKECACSTCETIVSDKV